METQAHQNQKTSSQLVKLALSGNLQEFTNSFKDLLAEHADEDIQHILPIEDVVDTEEPNSDVVSQIEAFAKQLSGECHGEDDGVIDISLKDIPAAKEFSSFLDNFLPVEDYDVYEVTETDDGNHSVSVETEAYDSWDQVSPDASYFQFIIYLDNDHVDGDEVLVDVERDDEPPVDDEFGEIMEVKKVVKINFRGQKIIRFKCNLGYKYDFHQKACVKRKEHDIWTRRRKALINILRRTAAKASIKKKINHKSLRFLLNRKHLGIKN